MIDRMSRQARQEIDELKARIETVISRDKTREPKLTKEEAQEIATLQAQINELDSAIPKLQKMLDEKRGRLNQLEGFHGWDRLIAGEDANQLIDELHHLEYAVKFLEDAYIYATVTKGTAQGRIDSIKKQARRKEQDV